MRRSFHNSFRLNEDSSQIYLFFICLLAYTCAYLSRDTFSATMPNILSTTDVTKTQLGTVSTIFLLCYGAGQMTSGLLGDRFRANRLIAIGLLGSAIANLGFAISETFFQMCVTWGLNGIALSLLWAPIVKVMTSNISDKYRYKCLINISVSMPAGTLIALLLSAVVIRVTGYNTSFMIVAAIIFASFLVWLVVYEKIKRHFPTLEDKKTIQQEASKTRISTIFAISGLLFISVAVMINGIVRNGISIWVPTYLTENFALEEFVSILTSTALPIVNLGGIYVASFINEKLKNEMITSSIMFGVAAVCMLLLILIGNISPIIAVLFLSVTTSSMQGLNAIVMNLVPVGFKKYGRVSTVTGYLNTNAYIASSVGSFVVGAISTTYGWNITILFWVACSLIGITACLACKSRWKNFSVNA